MDYDSSTKFISSLAKFLQSLCNGYVEFDNGVHVIGHLYLSVDTGTTIDYILNEKVCKTDENSVTFVSNSFHAQPAEKPKPASKRTGKDSEKVDSKNDSHGSGQTELKSTNSGTLPSSGNIQNSHGAKRPLSPSQRQSSKSGRVSPRHKKSRTESLEQNLPSHVSNPASENSVSSAPSPAADGLSNAFSAQGTDASQYSEPYQQSFFHPDEENSIGDDSEHQDIKPSIDTDVTFIKEEFASSPSGAQSDSQGRDRTHEEDSSTYPYQSNPVFPGAFTGQGGFVASGSGSHRSSFGASGDRSQMFGSGQGPSHLEGGEGSGDPSVRKVHRRVRPRSSSTFVDQAMNQVQQRHSAHSQSLASISHTSKQHTRVPTLGLQNGRDQKMSKDGCQYEFSCGFCSIPFVGFPRFSEHMRKFGTVDSECEYTAQWWNFYCGMCDLESESVDVFLKHIQTVHMQQNLTDNSPPADLACLDKQGDWDAKVADVQSKDRFVCNHCNKSYGDRKGLKRHLDKVRGVTFNCGICGKTYSREDVYKKHLKATHGYE